MIKLKTMLTEGLNYYYIATQYGSSGGGVYHGTLGIVKAKSRNEAFEKMKLPKPRNHYEVDLVSKEEAKRLKKNLEMEFKGLQSAMKKSDI